MTRIVTVEESRREQKRLHPYIKPVSNHAISMIVPGRRALGESWLRVTLGNDGDNITYSTEPTEAPADNKPIVAITGVNAEVAQAIITKQLEMAHGRAVAPQEMTHEERYALVNAAWHDWIEQKIRALRGVSTFGPGGANQRQRVYQNPSSRPLMHKE
jgi:hypothetical protein